MTLEQDQARARARARAKAKARTEAAPVAVDQSRGLLQDIPGVGPYIKSANDAIAGVIGQPPSVPPGQEAVRAGLDLAELYGKAPGLGTTEYALAGLKKPFSDKPYRQLLAEQQASTEAARERSGGAGLVAEFGGFSRLPSAAAEVAKTGAGWVKRGVTRALEGAGMSGATEVLDGSEGDPITAMLIGGTLSGAGGALIDAPRQVMDVVARYRANPTERARQDIYNVAVALGITRSTVDKAMQTHGGEVMAVDVLGKKGARLGQKAAAANPEAKDILDDSFAARQAEQNARVIGTREAVSGVKPGSTESVFDLKQKVEKRSRPGITAAYEDAEAAGYALELKPYKDILNTPMGRKAWNTAGDALKNFRQDAKAGGTAKKPTDVLARLDLAKQELDTIAENAKPSMTSKGDSSVYAQASKLANDLKTRMDEAIGGDEYANARAVAQKAFKTKEAIQTGANLAKPNLKLGEASKARAAETAEDRLVQRQANTQALKERLRNKRSVPSDIASEHTPAGQEAIAAVFGNRAPVIKQRAATEKMFAKTASDVRGGTGSDRAREMSAVLGSALGGAGAGYMFGDWTGLVDPLAGAAIGTTGGRGLKALKPLAERFTQNKGFKAAPEIARLLTSGPEAIPMTSPLKPAQDIIPDEWRVLFARLLAASGVKSVQQ